MNKHALIIIAAAITSCVLSFSGHYRASKATSQSSVLKFGIASSRNPTLRAQSQSEYDNYDDFLNLDKKIGGDEKKLQLTWQEVSIQPPKLMSESGEVVVDKEGKGKRAPPRKFRGTMSESSMVAAQRKWPNWDRFMEEYLGDLDEDLLEDEYWMWDARNAVEAKRGFAIWSKRSAKEIEKEVQKSIAAKTIGVPRSVATIIRALYMERSHNMKQIRKENELAAIEYRKWMIECKQKQKKDPVPLAKVEVSKQWLTLNPTGNRASAALGSGGGSGGSGGGMAASSRGAAAGLAGFSSVNPSREVNPALAPFASGSSSSSSSSSSGGGGSDFVSLKGKVIMDECAVRSRGTSFSGSGGLDSSSSGSGRTKDEGSAAATTLGSTTTTTTTTTTNNNVMVTSSMKLWNTKEEDMPIVKPTSSSSSIARQQQQQQRNKGKASMREAFSVDGEELFLPGLLPAGDDDYYVVM